jgi:hypothetical protein
MWLRMDRLPESFGVQAPLAGDRAQMLNYLTEYALVVSGGVLPPGRGREDFAKVCSRCHALPDPGAHSSQDWVAVFQRMERNMGWMKVSPPTAVESEGILLYLQSLPPKECVANDEGICHDEPGEQQTSQPPEYAVAAAGAGKEGLIDERGASDAARRAGAWRRGPGSGPEP